MHDGDDAVRLRASGWRTLNSLHSMIEGELERRLLDRHGLSAVEYSLLECLSVQDEPLVRMLRLSSLVGLSASATTRLVGRLEEQGLIVRALCREDRRGIYVELTAAGLAHLGDARPTHDAVLRDVLTAAERMPAMLPFVMALSSG